MGEIDALHSSVGSVTCGRPSWCPPHGDEEEKETSIPEGLSLQMCTSDSLIDNNLNNNNISVNYSEEKVLSD